MRITIRESRIDRDYWFWVLRDENGKVLDSGTSAEYELAKRTANAMMRLFKSR